MTETTLRVLLIEDDEDDFVLTSDLLNDVKGTKYEITWVSKYGEALPAICSGNHDICLIDYRLGEGNVDVEARAVRRGDERGVLDVLGAEAHDHGLAGVTAEGETGCQHAVRDA